MESLAELTARVADLERRLENTLQLAKVTSVDESTNLLDLEVRGVDLGKVPYLTHRAGEDGKTFWMPEVDEVGMLLCPAGDVGNAVFLPALNYDDRQAPRDDKDIMLRQFDGEAWEEWNGDDDTYMLRVSGDTEIKLERTPGKVEAKTGSRKITLLELGNATLELSPTVKAELRETGVTIQLSPTVKIDLGLTGITMTAPIVNVIGVLQVGGIPMTVP